MSQAEHLTRVVDALAEEFAGVLGRGTVGGCVLHPRALPAPAQGYIPELTHRFDRRRLRALRHAGLVKAEPIVRFTCYWLQPGVFRTMAAPLGYLAQSAVTAEQVRRPCR